MDAGRLSELAATGRVVGSLGKNIADRIGLNGGVLVVSDGHDLACATLGSGVIKLGLTMVSTGTAEVVEVAMSSAVLNESLRRGQYLRLSSCNSRTISVNDAQSQRWTSSEMLQRHAM